MGLFQSYLYGIEIEFQLLRFDTPQQFQSYLYGIEIDAVGLNELVNMVSIVPLWN